MRRPWPTSTVEPLEEEEEEEDDDNEFAATTENNFCPKLPNEFL
jgi:hypothetical protein